MALGWRSSARAHAEPQLGELKHFAHHPPDSARAVSIGSPVIGMSFHSRGRLRFFEALPEPKPFVVKLEPAGDDGVPTALPQILKNNPIAKATSPIFHHPSLAFFFHRATIAETWEPQNWEVFPWLNSSPRAVKVRRPAKSERADHQNVPHGHDTVGKPVRAVRENAPQPHDTISKPERDVCQNVVQTRQSPERALAAVRSSTSSNDQKDAYAALTEALGTTNSDFVQGLFGHLLDASARGEQKY